MRIPFVVSSLAILFGAAVPAAAQLDVNVSFGQRPRVSARFDRGGLPIVRRVPRCPPPVCEPRPCEPRPCDPQPRGHWETICEQVWVPGCFREEHHPAVWGWVTDPCGHRRWTIVQPEHCHRVWVPGHLESRERRVWVPCR